MIRYNEIITKNEAVTIMSLSLTDLQREQPRQVPLANWQDVLQAELNAFDTASSTVAGIGDVAKTIAFAVERFHIAFNTDNVLTFRTLNDTYILDVIGGLVLSQLLTQHYMGTVLPTGITESNNGVFETMSAWLTDIAAVVK
ncbi:hypothetical protein [Weissella cibaria]|uniref:hypothetical protein n=1 Tax=Weissella cibaria TaxID=137591 RepID=UPI001FA76593|nr:hypothetical protein [Weissella cibaria]